ncbi:MAG: SDR family oxidoreductase [Microbacteriaceae bacterium]|nr:SDR family oxidoreductase [Burkholderiaceae bacterium]
MADPGPTPVPTPDRATPNLPDGPTNVRTDARSDTRPVTRQDAQPDTRPVVLITGAAQRIGRSITLHLARHGWDVVLHHRGSATGRSAAEATAAEARALGAQAWLVTADLADEAACNQLVPAAVASAGRLDALVNNASLFEYDAVDSLSADTLDRHWRANTAAPVLLARALHRHLAQHDGRGAVVNLLDQKLANPNPDYFSYTLSKAALAEATVLLAQALAPRLRVCGVSPGVTLLSGTMDEAEFEAAHRLTPLHRSSTPEDIASAVRFLLESPAITGHTLLVDGGQHLLGQPRDVQFLAQQQLAQQQPSQLPLVAKAADPHPTAAPAAKD